MALAKGFLQGGQGWTEEGTMSKSNHVSSGGTTNGGIGRCWELGLNIQFPELGGGGVLALKDDSIIVSDSDGGLGKGHITSRIAQLPNQKQWLSGKVWYNMAVLSSMRKTREVKVSLVGRMKDRAGWGVDGHGISSGPFIADGGGRRKEMCCTPSVGNSIKWEGGRTSS